MEAASGFIATAQYIAYIDETYTYIHHSGIAFGMCVSKSFLFFFSQPQIESQKPFWQHF